MVSQVWARLKFPLDWICLDSICLSAVLQLADGLRFCEFCVIGFHSRDVLLPLMVLPQKSWKGGSGWVQLCPPVQFGSNCIPVEQFLPMLRFEHRSKLDQLGIDIISFDTEIS